MAVEGVFLSRHRGSACCEQDGCHHVIDDDFILAIGLIDGASDTACLRHVRRPLDREPDFGAMSVNYELAALLAQSEEPV